MRELQHQSLGEGVGRQGRERDRGVEGRRGGQEAEGPEPRDLVDRYEVEFGTKLGRTKRDALRHIKRALGHYALSDLNAAIIVDWFRERAREDGAGRSDPVVPDQLSRRPAQDCTHPLALRCYGQRGAGSPQRPGRARPGG